MKLPDKQRNVMIIKVLATLRRQIDKHGENLNKEIETVRKYQTEAAGMKIAITELKNTL